MTVWPSVFTGRSISRIINRGVVAVSCFKSWMKAASVAIISRPLDHCLGQGQVRTAGGQDDRVCVCQHWPVSLLSCTCHVHSSRLQVPSLWTGRPAVVGPDLTVTSLSLARCTSPYTLWKGWAGATGRSFRGCGPWPQSHLPFSTCSTWPCTLCNGWASGTGYSFPSDEVIWGLLQRLTPLRVLLPVEWRGSDGLMSFMRGRQAAWGAMKPKRDCWQRKCLEVCCSDALAESITSSLSLSQIPVANKIIMIKMKTWQSPHLEMSPQRFTMATYNVQ